jgi:pimeloyl-ACP methyl ester carboxylesterase
MHWIRRLPGFALKAWLAWRILGPEIPVRRSTEQTRPLFIPGRTVLVGDREIFVREAGPEDGIPLVLIHGWSFDGEMTYFAAIPTLAERFRVIVPDNRGHGRSDWSRGPYEISDVADDIAGLLDAIGVTEVIVFGYSMGGMVAQELAHRHPGLVSKLILAATAAAPMSDHGGRFQLALWLGRSITRVSRKEFSSVSVSELRRTRALAPEHVRWMWDGLMRRDPNLYFEAGAAVRRFDARPWIGSLSMPVRVIVNTDDQLMPPRAQYELASYFPDEDVVEVAGGRHESIMNRADEYAKLIGEFAD